jgi:uncharacterized membrane protein YbhN (UPF0104 family)
VTAFAPRRGLRRRLLRWGAAAVGLAVLVVTLGKLGPRRLAAMALEADPRWLTLSVAPIVGRFLVWGVKWHRMLRREAQVPFRAALRSLMAGCFVNLTTPTAKLGGGVLRAAFLERRYGWPLATAFGWVLADQTTNVLGNVLLFALLAIVGGLMVPAGGGAVAGLGLTTIALVSALIVARRPLWGLAADPRLAARLVRLTPARWRRGGADGEPGGWIRPLLQPLLVRATLTDLLLAAASFALLCASNALVLRALGVEAAPWIVVVTVAVGYFAGNGLGPWGGIGVTEAAMAAVYLRFGVAGDAAATGVLLHRASYYLLGLSWGGFALWRVGRTLVAEGDGG